MPKNLTGHALAKFEAERDICQEVLDGVYKIKTGGGKQVIIEPRSPTHAGTFESQPAPSPVRSVIGSLKTEK